MDGRVKGRIMVAGLLAACALMLVMANIVAENKARRAVTAVPMSQASLREIDKVIETLLNRFQIDRSKITSRNVQTPDTKLFRVERRVLVSPDFASLRLVQQLNQLVAPFGARAVATERTAENRVTVHVIRDRVIIQSIAFAVQQE